MNIKVLFAIFAVLFGAIFGYNYYAGKKSEEQRLAIQAEMDKAKADMAGIQAENAKNVSKPLIVEQPPTVSSSSVSMVTSSTSTVAITLTAPTPIMVETKTEPVAEKKEIPTNTLTEIKEDDSKSDNQIYYEATKKLNDVYARWGDAERLAQSTPRINLAAQIGEMQKLKQEASALEMPNCQDRAKLALVGAMTASIEAHYSFLQKNEISSIEKQKTADEGYKEYERIMKNFC